MRSVAPLIALAALLAALPAVADPVVRFNDGRTLPVERVELQAGMAILTLPGGGELALPAGRVVNWDELALEVSRPRPVPPIAPTEPWRSAAGPYADLIAVTAARHGVDPVLITAIAEVESDFDPDAVSRKGAVGLLQLMPDTAARFGVRDLFDVEQNVEGGARYLSWLLQRYSGQTDLALAGYNAGEGAVDRYRGVPPFRETRDYVDRVLAGTDRLLAATPSIPPAR